MDYGVVPNSKKLGSQNILNASFSRTLNNQTYGSTYSESYGSTLNASLHTSSTFISINLHHKASSSSFIIIVIHRYHHHPSSSTTFLKSTIIIIHLNCHSWASFIIILHHQQPLKNLLSSSSKITFLRSIPGEHT